MSPYETISPSQVLLQYLLALESMNREDAAAPGPSLEIPVMPEPVPVDFPAPVYP
jgi:hypothetical protein